MGLHKKLMTNNINVLSKQTRYVKKDLCINWALICVLLMQEKKVKKSKDTREKNYNGNPFQREHEKRNTKQVDILVSLKIGKHWAKCSGPGSLSSG